MKIKMNISSTRTKRSRVIMEVYGEVSSAISSFFLPTFACLFSTYGNDGVRSYEGYQVFRVETKDNRFYDILTNMYHQEGFDFWTRPSLVNPTDILVPPQQIDSLISYFGFIGLNYTIMNANIQYAVEYEKLNDVSRQVTSVFNWDAYHRVDTIHGWMDSMAEQYPNLVYIENIGGSTEGRTLKVMKISTGGRNSNKTAIWLDGGIHAREWIAPSVVTYIANELISQHISNLNISTLVDMFDWYIDPVLNPDGYEYTHTNDRFWRKTRSGGVDIFGGLLRCCKGTDANRNWNFQWGGKGTSSFKCSQIYHGAFPNSEPEVEHLQNFILARKDHIKLFLTIHSYSQLLLLPWGYDSIKTDDYQEMMTMGNKALKALEEVHGTVYTGGATPDLLYPASGGSHDWAKGIQATGEETFAGVKSMAEYLVDYYKLATSHPRQDL